MLAHESCIENPPYLGCRLLEPFGIEIDFDENLLVSDRLKTLVLRHKIVVLKSCENFDESFLRSKFSCLGTIVDAAGDGGIYEVVPRLSDSFDKVMTDKSVPLHWDGFAANWSADFQVFLCTSAADTGGGTLFANTEGVYEDLDPETRQYVDHLEARYFIPDHYRYFTNGIDLQHFYKIKSKHRLSNRDTLRLVEMPAEFVLEHTVEGFAVQGLSESETFSLYKSLFRELYHPKHLLVHYWSRGDIVITDNNALLHGRQSFTGNRRLIRMLYAQNDR
jgi:alpha-ketoglutarate-dependent taurine dioxygenase